MILLLGVITVGAMLVIAAGGMALQSFQENAEGGLAEDTAVQAHASLAEAASTGTPQSVPIGEGAVDSRLVDGGTLTISMYDASGTCSARVSEDLGALRYEGGDRAMIYEGGAIWAETEAGLAVERAPPISHSPETTRISVLSVAAATIDDGGGFVARPNESARERVAQQTEELLTRCPANGYTSLRINVTSPYADGWERHFREAVDTTADVTVTRTSLPGSDAVVAEIENATDPTSTDGLGLYSVDAPTAIVPGDDFSVEAAVANDGFDAANATVELDVPGPGLSRSGSVNVSPFSIGRTNLTIDAATINGSLTPGTTYDYTVTVRNESGSVVSTANGSFTFGTISPMVELDAVDDALGPAHDDLTITATLRNYGLQNGTGSVTLDLTDPAINASPRTAGPVNVSGGGTTDVAYDLDVSGLSVGTYQYEVDGPNGTITDSFTISNRSGGGPMAGDVRITDVDPSDTHVAVGDDFGTSVSLENVANGSSTADVTLDVEGLSPETRTVTLGPGGTDTVFPTADASAVGSLPVGAVHDYTVTLEAGNESETLNGSFYLGESGADLAVESVAATNDNGSVTIAATLSNDGVANGTDAATLSLTDPDGDAVTFASTPQQSVTTHWGSSSTVTFDLDLSVLAGNYTYSVAYGGDAESGTLSLEGINHTNNSVAISGGGNGTVRVLGTEISGEWGGGSDWTKRWSPTSVSVLQETDGVESTHEFQNDGGDVEDDRNLNSYDTQEEIYTYDWQQDANETTMLTIQSAWWAADGADWETVNDRWEDGRHWTDRQPEDGLGAINRRVDADSGQNPENVRVLTDGDQVPQVSGVNPDQRNASEVLNQGAADRIDPDTNELTLAPNEAVFLFEMTETTDDVPGDMWEYALNNDVSDPDYNDVIAIVEFEPDGNGSVPVEMSATPDGTGIVITTPGVTGAGNGTVTIGDVNASAGSGAPPGDEPIVPGIDVSSPSPPEDVEIEVDVIQLD